MSGDHVRSDRGGLWRSRWAAIGAAVAVSVGAGGIVHFASAASGPPSDFVSITPVRVLDTRDGVNVGLPGPFVSPVAQDLVITGNVSTTSGPQVVVPAGASGVVLNVTIVQPTSAGFLSVRPADAPGAPATSSLNFEAGVIQPNSVTVQVPTVGADAGKIEIVYDAYGTAGPATDVLVDVVGYYQASGAPTTGVVSIPWAAFFPASPGEYSGYGATSHSGRFLTGVGGDGANRLLAPVQLPEGATVTSVTFGVYDDGAADASLTLNRFAHGAITSDQVAQTTSSGAMAGVREFVAPVVPDLAVIDNSAYTYTATIFLTGWTAADLVEIDYVTISYALAAT